MKIKSGVSVVVPVYHSASTIGELVRRIIENLAGDFEIILVDDGDMVETWNAILKISQTNSEVIGLRFGRNYGQHSALLAGIRKAKYSVIVTLDDDLQNPPEEIPNLLAKLVNGVDVVYGVST